MKRSLNARTDQVDPKIAWATLRALVEAAELAHPGLLPQVAGP